VLVDLERTSICSSVVLWCAARLCASLVFFAGVVRALYNDKRRPEIRNT